MENLETNIEKEKLISDIEPIEESRSKYISELEDFDKLVEEPLRDAVRILTQKGIQTLSSSANKKDFERKYADIIINFETLSDENKEIIANKEYAEKIQFDEFDAVEIKIPMNSFTKVSDIRDKSTEIANDFKMQNASWIPEYSLEKLLVEYAIPLSEKQYYASNPQDFEEYYFDSETKKFYTGKWICELKKKLSSIN